LTVQRSITSREEHIPSTTGIAREIRVHANNLFCHTIHRIMDRDLSKTTLEFVANVNKVSTAKHHGLDTS
jgi:hypothetical protein